MATIADLKPDPKNARRHTPRNVGMIETSIQRDGFGRSILTAKDGTIIAGNATWEAAASAGIEDRIVVESDGTKVIEVRRTDLEPDSPEFHRLALADNRSAELAEWDPDVLRDLAADVDLSAFWREDELAAVLASFGEPTVGLTDPDAVPEVPDEPATKPGDLWRLGPHRLLCGDATRAEDVNRLMADERAACLWTDPPYGVDYVGKTADALTIANDDPGGLEGLLRTAFANAIDALVPGAPFYVAHPAGPLSLVFQRMAHELGWRVRQTLVWVKDSLVLGHADYHYRHEPVLYGFLPGGEGRRGRGGAGWYGGDAQTTVFEIPRPKASLDHPTCKPVALIAAMVANSTKPGDRVLDLFAGSGSTLVACEELGRVCRLLELDPRYCDVIVSRYESFTGQRAVLATASAEAEG